MSAKTNPNPQMGKTSAASAEEPKKQTIQVMTGNNALVGQCSYAGCPYDENSKLSTNMGVVQLKNTNYIFHPDCYQKFAQDSRNAVTNDPNQRIQNLRDQNAREVTLQKQ